MDYSLDHLIQIIMILTLNIQLNLISLKKLLELKKLNPQYQYQLLMVLENGDLVTLTVKPKQSLGIGTSESILLKYNSANDKILVNPISFGSTSVNLTKNEFELTSHGFETGEKVFYDSSNFITGLGTGSYFVHRVDDNKFNLSLTRKDSLTEPPSIIDLQSQGSLHEISKINPVIPVIKNNNLVFNTGDCIFIWIQFKNIL